MLRLRHLSWIVVCAILFSTVAPALPAYAAPAAAVQSPTRQDEVTDRIAEIRNNDPDIEEDFSKPSSLFETGYDGTTTTYLKSGELHIAVDEENTLAWSKLNQDVADYYMEVETIHREGSLDNQYGILARFDEDGNYYLFAASSDGYYTIQIYQDGEWNALVEWTETETIQVGEGEHNTLGLLAEGDSYTLLINDTVVDEVTDDTLSGTTLALNAAAFSEPPIDLGFDNFRLWNIGTPIEKGPRQAPVDGRNVTVTAVPSGTAEATVEPTEEATEEPTGEATLEPTEEATVEPTEEPTEEATVEPTEEPTEEATIEPTEEATAEPTEEATPEPTAAIGTSSDPIIAAIQGQTPTFSDDFEDGDNSDWSNFPSDFVDYDVSDSALALTFNSPNLLSWSQLPISPTNYYVEADATITTDIDQAEYGIIFNYVDAQNFYLYAINNGSRYSVWQLANNSWVMIYDWADSGALLSGNGSTNRLGLLVQAGSLTLTANDEVLAEITEDNEASGGIALAAGTFDEQDLTISFDNVALWDLDTLESLPTVEPTDEATAEPTEETTAEPTEEATGEPTVEPTEEANQDFSNVTARIAEITANDPDISDDFRRDSGTWDTQSHDFGNYYYEGRALNIEATQKESIVWSAYYENKQAVDPVQFGDFYAEFDTSFVTYTGENTAGLVFRLVDTDNFYKFVVDEIGYLQLQKRVDGDYSDIIEWTLTDAVDDTEGATNRIGILAEGSTLALSINGTVVAQAEDSDLDSGAIALAIQTYTTPEGHSTFDNFELWELDK
jgi:hypothetical protein